MKRWTILLVALCSLPVTLWSSSTAIAANLPLVSAAIMAKATNVAVCEEGGWINDVDGPTYYGSLGWLAVTWAQYRAPSFPASAYLATPAQQAWAMAHFVGAKLHGWWPDQVGCTGGY